MLEILLVEDNPGDVYLVKRALAEYRIAHNCHVARDGAEALALVEGMGRERGIPCPDIVLLDLNLPKADGTEILSAFRKHVASALTPVLVMTSSNAPKDRARLAELGVTRYFRKPSTLEGFMELGRIVRELAGESAVVAGGC